MRQTHALALWLAMFCFALPGYSQLQARQPLSASGFFQAAHYQGLSWRSIGPFRGGRSVAVAGVKSDPLTYYMGTTGGGLWKTEDAGVTWLNISDPFFHTGSIGAIAVADTDPNLVYAGAGEHPVRGTMTSHGDGVYKSTDGGRTWVHLGLERSRHIAAIRLHPTDPDIVFVAVQGSQYGSSEERGVFKSTDGGETWCKVLYYDANTGACDLSIDPANPRILYAGMWDHRRTPWAIRSGGPGSGLYRSVDGGENWERLTGGLPREMGKVAVAVSPANSDVVYANLEAAEGGVYRSDDGGRSWRRTSADRATVGRAWYFTEIVPDPTDVETVYVLNAPLLRSVDGGRSFESIATPHADQHDLWINPRRPANFILANDGGTCVTFNGGQTWSSQLNQPTGQFYRVIADGRFPYYLYGGQQDNTTVAIPSRTAGAGIGLQDWYPVGGCESGFLAFDPRDPRRVFGGCYQGYIEAYDQETKQSKDVSAYPELGLATNPANLKYRFNWNAPIVAQPQDPSIIYHAANVVLRTADGGLSWREISPDLTRNQPEKQGAGGGPFTNEGAGGENYNTISYLACSPHAAGVIWAGSDDGLVHLTRDEGATWTDVTPPGLGEALINSIEVSPHRPEAAYLVATRYKFEDLRPLIYYTADYGRNWTIITNGIAGEHFVRVVREDPVQPGLLYAGTERAFYVSFDNGRRWNPLQLNLPPCPVTDLTIRDNDLIAATAGRGFWILDDLGPLQQSPGRLTGDQALLFRPKPAYRLDPRETPAPEPNLGQNPPGGVIIDYFLPPDLDSALLTLQVLDARRQVIRTFRNRRDSTFVDYQGGPPAAPLLPSRAGINRFHWDLRREPLPGIPRVFMPGNYRGTLVAPGEYFIRLSTPLRTLEQPCLVLPDPRVDAGATDYVGQQETLLKIENAVRDIHHSVRRMREVKKQVEFLILQMQKAGCAESVIRQGKAVQKKLADWEESLIQSRHQTYQDVINYPNHLNGELMHLLGRVDTHDPRLPGGARQRADDLLHQWERQRTLLQEILGEDLARFNRLYKEQDLPVVLLPSSAD